MLFGGLIVACQAAPVATHTALPATTDAFVSPKPTLTPTETPDPPTPTLTLPTPTQTPTAVPPTETPVPACVTLIYEEYAQFEIITSAGQRILIDVNDPAKLSGPVSANDILLTTHTHWDHYNPDFQSDFPGAQLFLQAANLDFPGGSIQGLASAHNAEDRLMPEGGTNYIYVIEIGEWRIAHFGDIGQNELNAEQISRLNQIDVALTQINNPYSDMNAENNKGIHLMAQLQPRLVIPTHLNLDTVKSALTQWAGFYTQSPFIELCKTDLSEDGTQILLMGEAAKTMINYVELDMWD
jgi:hypothetical protein